MLYCHSKNNNITIKIIVFQYIYSGSTMPVIHRKLKKINKTHDLVRSDWRHWGTKNRNNLVKKISKFKSHELVLILIFGSTFDNKHGLLSSLEKFCTKQHQVNTSHLSLYVNVVNGLIHRQFWIWTSLQTKEIFRNDNVVLKYLYFWLILGISTLC